MVILFAFVGLVALVVRLEASEASEALVASEVKSVASEALVVKLEASVVLAALVSLGFSPWWSSIALERRSGTCSLIAKGVYRIIENYVANES